MKCIMTVDYCMLNASGRYAQNQLRGLTVHFLHHLELCVIRICTCVHVEVLTYVWALNTVNACLGVAYTTCMTCDEYSPSNTVHVWNAAVFMCAHVSVL